MANREVKSILFIAKDSLITNLVLEHLDHFGELAFNINDNVTYFSKSDERYDVLAKPNQVIIGLNLDFSMLIQREKFKMGSSVSPSIDQTYTDYFEKINLLGFQRHLIPKEILVGVDLNKRDNLSLGVISNDLTKVEPVLRNSDVVNLDLGSIRSSDLAHDTSRPAGFSIETFIQIAKYAGYSNNLKILNFTFKGTANEMILAELLATSIWYFLESIQQNLGDNDGSIESFLIEVENSDQFVTFYQSFTTKKCWMTVETGETPISISISEFNEAKESGVINKRVLDLIMS